MNMRNEQLIRRFENHPHKAELKRALEASEKFSDRAAAIKSNKDLSDAGRAKETKAQLRAALRDIRDAASPVTEMKAKLAAIQEGIKRPSFDKTDIAGALARQEIRAAIRAMPLGDRAALLTGDGADPRYVDAVLEQPPLLSGTPPELFEKILSQRLESVFSAEIAQGEDLDNQIAEAEAALQIARQDVQRASGLAEHEFNHLAEAIDAKKSAPWLRREGANVVVIPLAGGPSRLATVDEVRDGKFYASHAEFLANRAA
jgi:hypothetical protein